MLQKITSLFFLNQLLKPCKDLIYFLITDWWFCRVIASQNQRSDLKQSFPESLQSWTLTVLLLLQRPQRKVLERLALMHSQEKRDCLGFRTILFHLPDHSRTVSVNRHDQNRNPSFHYRLVWSFFSWQNWPLHFLHLFSAQQPFWVELVWF